MTDELEDILTGEIDDEEDEPGQLSNKAFAAMRAELKKKERDLKKAQERIAALVPFEEQVKVQGLRQVFSQVGLSEKHAELFRAARGDVEATEESVRTFAQEYELPIKETEPAPEAQPEPVAPAFPPPVQGAGAIPQGIFTPEEAVALFTSNPERYMRLREQGQIQLDKSPDTHFVGRDK